MPNRTSVHPHLRIRLARKKANLSQARLALELKVHRSAVSQWEAPSAVLPTVENLIKLARLTEVQMEWLSTGRGRMHYEKDIDDTPAVMLEFYAHDRDEAELLRLYRELKSNVKKTTLDLLKALVRTK